MSTSVRVPTNTVRQSAFEIGILVGASNLASVSAFEIIATRRKPLLVL